MRIAVCYDPTNEKVFPHFGQTEFFKVYEVENNKVISSEVRSTNGLSHHELVGLIVYWKVDVVLSDGMGPGARDGLTENGIRYVRGYVDKADQAVEDFLAGKIPDYDPSEQTECCCGCEEPQTN